MLKERKRLVAAASRKAVATFPDAPGLAFRPEREPGLPPLVRPTAGHIVAAACLTILIAAIYGTIAWGMFTGSGAFRAHIGVAQRLYDTGRPSIPHFLFHALTVGLFAFHLAPSLVTGGRLVMIGCYLLVALLMYCLFWIVFQHSRVGRPAILFLVALATFLAQPINLSQAYELGYFWPEPYEIPTSTMLKPFALAGFACTAWYLSRRRRIDVRLVVLFGLATAAGSLSKPSFLICILPATALLAIYRLVRGLPVSVAGLLAGLYLPAAAVLAWQFYETYFGYGANAMYHDSLAWAPFKFMNYWTTDLLSKFLLTIVFPLVLTVVYWKKARRDPVLQLAWLSFLFGAFYSYMLVEKANWSAGNFTWSGGITAFTLFVGSAVFWLRHVSSERAGGWPRLVSGGAFALHALCGLRMDWLYLTHSGCTLDFRLVSFVCPG